jgi:putative SOS response-associated peptidase YedK
MKDGKAMCGRYSVVTEEEVLEMRAILAEINERYIDTHELSKMKNGEIRPTDIAPVLASGESGTEARLMAWGFPKWQGTGVVINARSETIAEKEMFRSSLKSRRCIIPSTGFYEWSHKDGKSSKDKFLITLPGEQMLYMAGLYNSFADKAGERCDRFVILTRTANESIAPLHSRMPVILPAGQKEQWLYDYGNAMGMITGQDTTELLLQQGL